MIFYIHITIFFYFFHVSIISAHLFKSVVPFFIYLFVVGCSKCACTMVSFRQFLNCLIVFFFYCVPSFYSFSIRSFAWPRNLVYVLLISYSDIFFLNGKKIRFLKIYSGILVDDFVFISLLLFLSGFDIISWMYPQHLVIEMLFFISYFIFVRPSTSYFALHLPKNKLSSKIMTTWWWLLEKLFKTSLFPLRIFDKWIYGLSFNEKVLMLNQCYDTLFKFCMNFGFLLF